jgi:hypothetical protein
MRAIVQSVALLTGLSQSEDNANGMVGKGEGHSHKPEEAP